MLRFPKFNMFTINELSFKENYFILFTLWESRCHPIFCVAKG